LETSDWGGAIPANSAHAAPTARGYRHPRSHRGGLGQRFVPQTSHRWFRRLRQPKMAIPFPAFVTVGAVYYVLLGVVRYRALQRAVAGDRISTRALAPYTIWVLAYDVPWSYGLWRLNP
jgi:benzodiazapine receptor